MKPDHEFLDKLVGIAVAVLAGALVAGLLMAAIFGE